MGVVLPALVSGQPATSEASVVRFDDLLWREVQNVQGEELGGVSDVLVQMPSGRIVFVAVDPSQLFERPKAVPPGVLIVPADRDAPLRLDVAKDRWINAPRLDWDAALVIKNTMEGGKIYGYYQEAWRDPDPGPPWGMTVVAAPTGEPAERYVSLKKLLMERIVTNGGQQAGYVRDFVLDWSAKRATHALVSPQFTPLARPDAMWFAVPAPLLTPPTEDDAITVNSSVEAFRRAPSWPAGQKTPGDAITIHRYPAGSPSGDTRAAKGFRR